MEVKGQQHIGQDRSLPVIGSDPLDQRAEAKDDAPSLRGHGQSTPLPTLPERKDEGSLRVHGSATFLNEEIVDQHQSYQLVVIKMLG